MGGTWPERGGRGPGAGGGCFALWLNASEMHESSGAEARMGGNAPYSAPPRPTSSTGHMWMLFFPLYRSSMSIYVRYRAGIFTRHEDAPHGVPVDPPAYCQQFAGLGFFAPRYGDHCPSSSLVLVEQNRRNIDI